MPKRWYYIEANLAHQGAGKFVEVPIYIFAVDAFKAYNRLKFLPGIQKSNPREIKPIDEAKVAGLEKMMVDDGLNLDQVKANWYTTDEYYKQFLFRRLRRHKNEKHY